MEVGIGITCGNLPLLRPVFSKFFDKSGATMRRLGASRSRGLNNSQKPTVYRSNGFELMSDKNAVGVDVQSIGDTGSEVALHDLRYDGKGIKVVTNVELKVEDDMNGVRFDRDAMGNKTRTNVKAVRSGF